MNETYGRIPEGVEIKFFDNEGQTAEDQLPFVALNGIGAGVDAWGGFMEAFRRETVAIDVAGASRCANWASMARYSDELVRMLDCMDADKVDLLGVSWGGALAQETAVRHGDRIGRLVLAATMPGATSFPGTLEALRLLSTSDRSSDEFYSKAGVVFGGDIRRDPELLKHSGVKREIDPVTYGRQKRAIMTWPHGLPRLALVQNPTLIMAGQDDPIAKPVNALMMRAVMRRARLHLIRGEDGGGHLFLHTRPAASAAVVERFLEAGERPLRQTA